MNSRLVIPCLGRGRRAAMLAAATACAAITTAAAPALASPGSRPAAAQAWRAACAPGQGPRTANGPEPTRLSAVWPERAVQESREGIGLVMPRWNRGKDKADTAAPTPFAVPEWVIDSGQHYREAAELARTGSRGRATITSVTYGSRLQDGVVWTIGMRVQPDDGDAFDSELALALDAEFQDDPPRDVGETAAIVFDPSDHARVRFLPPHLASDGP